MAALPVAKVMDQKEARRSAEARMESKMLLRQRTQKFVDRLYSSRDHAHTRRFFDAVLSLERSLTDNDQIGRCMYHDRHGDDNIVCDKCVNGFVGHDTRYITDGKRIIYLTTAVVTAAMNRLRKKMQQRSLVIKK